MRPANRWSLQSSLGGRSPGCRSDPRKARGVSIPVSAKHARRDARSRLRGQGRQLETGGPHRGVTSRARGIASSLAPPADGRREPVTALSLDRDSMSREGSVSRLRGRKTLAPLLGLWPRERAHRDERSRRRTKMPHRAKACVAGGNGRIHRERRGTETSSFRQVDLLRGRAG
jgi:hypothetical protein